MHGITPHHEGYLGQSTEAFLPFSAHSPLTPFWVFKAAASQVQMLYPHQDQGPAPEGRQAEVLCFVLCSTFFLSLGKT